MSSSTTKKVYLRRFDRSYIEGYVSPATFQRPDGVEILKRSAQVIVVPYHEVRALYFVRDFEGLPDGDEEKRVFGSRPKVDGLWVRLTFRDDEAYEGVIANDLLALHDPGVLFSPPDANSNTQRIYVPHAALKEFKVLGVIGTPAHRRRTRRKVEPGKEQGDLFAASSNERPAQPPTEPPF
ncbi:MAG: hypothetical protein GC160_02400 [Acidobacteria bacterium]|nr:hypothetical protein [Acidobacteriota bacterium]